MSEELNDPVRRATKITRSMLDISTSVYGYQDIYVGRVPRMLHEIPEADIWECNPEYTGLIYMYLQGTLLTQNISQELLRQIQSDIILIGRLDLIETYEEKKIATCAGFGPTGWMECSDDYDCNEILICDYKPYNVYQEYPPTFISDFVASNNLVHEVKFDWTLASHGTQPIYYDIYAVGYQEEPRLVAIDVEPGVVIYEPYGEREYRVRAYNSAGYNFSPWEVGASLMPSNLGSLCCSQLRSRCIDFNVNGEYDIFPHHFITADDEQFQTGIFHNSCSDPLAGTTECDQMNTCVGGVCPDCIGLKVYGRACDDGEYGFIDFYTVNGRRFNTSDYHGSCETVSNTNGSGYDCPGECTYCTDFHVWDPIDRVYGNFTAAGDEYIVSIECPSCVDLQVWDENNNEFVKYITRNRHYVISPTHGSCPDSLIVLEPQPYFGADCRCEPCGNCLTFNTYERNSIVTKFKPRNSSELKVSYLKYGMCGSGSSTIEFGLNCEPMVDCPPCADFKVWNVKSGQFEMYVSSTRKYHVSTMQKSCISDSENMPDFGLTCNAGVDCPECINLNVYNVQTNEMNSFGINGGIDNYLLSSLNGTCGSNIGLDCGDLPCPACADFRCLEDSITNKYSSFISFNGNFISSSEVHGECGVGEIIPDEGLNCTPDEDCPNCINFYTYNGTSNPDRYHTNTAEPIMVGFKHGSCTQDIDDAYAIGTGIDCDGGACPDCGDYRVWDSLPAVGGQSTFYSLWEKSGNFMSSLETSGTCGETIAPNAPTDVTASTTNVEYVEVTWTDSTLGTPTPTYNMYRDDSLVDGSVTSPWLEYIGEGTYEYYIRAVNHVGSAESAKVSGTSVSGTVPELYSVFISDGDNFIVNGEPFMVAK